jgi:hypothetical protein
MRVVKQLQCESIVQPGEYTISKWDGERCFEKSPIHLIRCDICEKHFCYMHWGEHVREGCPFKEATE